MAVFRSPALRDATTVTPAEPRRVEPSGILHFTIGVTDLGRARAFYEDVLGCTYWRQNEITVFMRAGNDHFVLSRTGYHEPPNRGTDTLIHHAFIMNGADFDVAMAHLESMVAICRKERLAFSYWKECSRATAWLKSVATLGTHEVLKWTEPSSCSLN